MPKNPLNTDRAHGVLLAFLSTLMDEKRDHGADLFAWAIQAVEGMEKEIATLRAQLADQCPLPLRRVWVIQEAVPGWTNAADDRNEQITAWLNARVPAVETSPEVEPAVAP
jgi:hypothetical protein